MQELLFLRAVPRLGLESNDPAPRMKTRTKWIIGGCFSSAIAAGGLVLVALWIFLPAVLMTPRGYSSVQMWMTTHEWTRTAPLPATVSDVGIQSLGSAFTRQFRATAKFNDKPSLESWMEGSPGFTDAVMTEEADGSKVYSIQPGGGAMHAEIKVYPDLRVEINTYWS